MAGRVMSHKGATMFRARVRKDRGCVDDQPQHNRIIPTRQQFRELLRLVEDDTVALRDFQTGA
jgi:hypothetical protein